MTVRELIKELRSIENKDLQVYGYCQTNSQLFETIGLDCDLVSRVDINMAEI